MVLQDTATGLQIVLDQALPDEGYQQLLNLDMSQFRLGPVHYDQVQRRWRSELDEAQPRLHRHHGWPPLRSVFIPDYVADVPTASGGRVAVGRHSVMGHRRQ